MTLPNFSPGMTLEDFDKAVRYNEGVMVQWRYGQCLFNTLSIHRPDIAEAIRGTESDPFYAEFYSDNRSINAWSVIMEKW